MRNLSSRLLFAIVAASPVMGCQCVLGLDEPLPYPANTGGSGGIGGTGGDGATTAMTGGNGGTAGTGGSTSTSLVCIPEETAGCYTGPSGTEGVGICSPGIQTCLPDGSGFGSCENEILPQLEDCASPVDEDCDGAAQSCKGQLVWAKRFGPKDVSPGGYATIRDLAVDSDGHLVVVGAFTQSIDFGGIFLTSAGISDVFVAKLNGQTGATFWAKQFGDSAIQDVFSVAVDAEDHIILGGHVQGTIDFGGGALTSAGTSDAFLAKLDKDGAHIWSKRFGDTDYQEITGVSVDSGGSIVAAGSFAGTVNLGGALLTSAGSRDILVGKFDADGNHIWSNRFGNGSAQSGAHVAADVDGNVLLTGQFAQAIDVGGGALTSLGDKDVFAAKLDTGGTHIWSQGFGGADEQSVSAVAGHAGGNVLLAGTFYGSIMFGAEGHDSAGETDGFLAILQPDGSPLWTDAFGDSVSQEATDIAADAFGNLVLAGTFDGSVNMGGEPLSSGGGLDILVAKVAQDGVYQWSKRFGDAANQRATAVATDQMGNVLLGGTFSGTVDFGGMLLSAESSSFDGFIVKLSP